MLRLRRPTPEQIQRFLSAQTSSAFTYAEAGATATSPPPGFVVDRTRACLGHGSAAFHAVRAALQHWQQFDLGWLGAAPVTTPIAEGAVVAIVAHILGVWWLNACRIVYVVDEPTRFGFAYGTLPGHVGAGEERFLVEWERVTDAVMYEVLAFSRPHGVLARLGYPYMRGLQKRFGPASAAALQRVAQSAVSS